MIYETAKDVRSLSIPVLVYSYEERKLPNSLQEVILDSESSKEKWNRDYQLKQSDERNAIIYSLGPNGLDESGGGDDISYEFDFSY